MAAWLAVLTDKGAYVRIARAQEGESGVLNLTTLLPSQDRAYVEVYVVQGAERRHLHTFRLANLQHGDPRPQIVVSAHFRGGATVTLRVNGEVVASQRLSVPEAVLQSGRGALAATLLLLLLVAAVAFGVTWLASRTDPTTRLPVAARPAPARPAPARPEAEPPAPVLPEPLASEVEEPRIGEVPGVGEEPATEPGPGPPDRLPPAVTPPVDHTVYFEPERAELLEEGRHTLAQVAAAITGWVDEGGDPDAVAMRVEGHTALYGSERSRFELSEQRAAVVAAYLYEQLSRYGVALEVTTVGKGGAEPVTRARDDEWRNRRAEITVGPVDR